MPHHSFYYYLILINVIYFIMTAVLGLTLILLAWAAYRKFFAHMKAVVLLRTRLSSLFHSFIDHPYTSHGAIITFILCGITGAMVDVDHVPELLLSLMGVSIQGRLLHSTFFIIACVGCIYYGNLLYRYLKQGKDGSHSQG